MLAVGDADFQRKCLGKMGDVADSGRTVLFVSHNMSAIQRLTQDSIVLDKGKVLLRAPSAEAVDFYLNRGLSKLGERFWEEDEVPVSSTPFRPLSIRILDKTGQVSDSVRSVEPIRIEIDYELTEDVTGLRVGYYLFTTRGEPVFTSFDIDSEELFKEYTARPKGIYTSRCTIPPDTLNEGRFLLGINASSYGIRRYFQDDQALSFSVDASGARAPTGPNPGRVLCVLCLAGKLSRKAAHDEKAPENLLGKLPFAAEAYWMFEGSKKPWNAHYQLAGLQEVLPQAVAEVKQFGLNADPPEKVCIFATLHYWIEQAGLVALALSGQGHQVELSYLPYAEWDKPISSFDLRMQHLYSQQVLLPAGDVMGVVSLMDFPSYSNDSEEKVSLSDYPPELKQIVCGRFRTMTRSTPCRWKKQTPGASSTSCASSATPRLPWRCMTGWLPPNPTCSSSQRHDP